MVEGDIVTINFHNCGGYVNAIKAKRTFIDFKVFNETTNNVFIVIYEKSFSMCYCLTQYGIYEFINSHLKLI